MRIRGLALFLACLAALAGCTHSRIVERDDAPRSGHVRDSRTQGSSRPRAASEALPRNAIHVVRAGETLYGISFRYGLRYQDVAAWNGIGDPFVIEIGQRLRLRPAGVAVAPARAAPRAATPRPASSDAGPPQTPSPPAATDPRQGTAQALQHAPPVDIGSQSIGGGPAFSWPTQGQIIGRHVAGDQTRQGINIAGVSGQPVRAAADGVVVYSGAGLSGYGELIIIKHSDEWLSAYAHNRRRLAAEGARVRSGQVIAEMGRTAALRDMLHFEIRRNGKPVDPLAYLPRP